MRIASGVSALLLAAAALCGQGRQGLKPRANPNEYPYRTSRNSVAIGAELLTSDEVRHRFATDLDRGYIVVEVGVFPEDRIDLDLSPDDFVLRITGPKTAMLRPVTPRAIASVLQKTGQSDRDITLYPSVGVGYESGPPYYDPMGGTTRGGGWRTSVGVGVGVGGSGPPATDGDRATMEMELSEQSLPEGVVSHPVAGYLYFPLPEKTKMNRTTRYELQYRSGRRDMTIPLSAAAGTPSATGASSTQPAEAPKTGSGSGWHRVGEIKGENDRQ